jgi:hypothetical protein
VARAFTKGSPSGIAIHTPCPTDRLRDMTCELTMLGGKVVHKASVTPITIAAR